MDTPAAQQQKQTVGAPLLALGVLLLLTVGTSLIPASWIGLGSPKREYAPLNLSLAQDLKTLAQDTDNDGTISWKEYIAGSLGVSGTSTSMTDLETDPRTIAALNDPNNLTASFTKNLYMASVALQQEGVNDPTTEQQIITKLIQGEQGKVEVKTYTQEDIKIGKDNSAYALKVYGNSVASILQGFITEQSITDDITGIGNFTNSKNEADLIAIVKSKKRIDSVMEKLLSVEVPSSAAPVHVDILNRIGKYDATLKDLTRAYDDPVRATFAIKSYADDAVSALQSIPYLAQFFEQKHAVFSLKDPGYLFMGSYTNK